MKKSIFCAVLCLLLLVSNLTALVASAEDSYVDNWVYLEMGTNEYETDTTVAYTALHIAPEETGKYTIACSEQQIGMASYNDMWVSIEPTADTVNTHSIVWECTSVGQGIIIAVESGDGSVAITVTREDLVQKEEVQWTVYENQVTPAAFTVPFDTAAAVKVNTTDAVADTAVLGADGYYHLNAADGPILFAKLNDSAMSLQAMINYGQIKEVVQDADHTVLSKTDFNTAMTDYVNCMDSTTGLYPLTADLIAVYQRVGMYKGWYGANGYVGGELEDAWMFACYYVDGFTAFEAPAGDVNGDGKADAADAAALFCYINGIGTLDDIDAADLNGDGVINLHDAGRLFYMVNGLI